MTTDVRDNEALPFDVLCHIFGYYEETIETPLETLLLVCRLWNVAALKCRRIWSDINIRVGDRRRCLHWSRILPCRLSKSGPSSPIYFRLTIKKIKHWCGSTDGTDCKCPEFIRSQIVCILRAIVGPDGSYCSRWTAIDINSCWIGIGIGLYTLPSNIGFFSHPTPNLRSLRLNGVKYSPKDEAPFLPSTPQLRKVDLMLSFIPSLPVAKSLSVLKVTEFGEDPGLETGIPDFSQLSHAENLKILEFHVNLPRDPFYLPLHLPYLKRLSISGVQVPSNIEHVEVPILKVLDLQFDLCDNEVDSIIQIASCKKISFDKVRILIIRPYFYALSIDSLASFWNAYKNILSKCYNVQKIITNEYSTPLLLQLLRSHCEEKEKEESRNNQRDHLADHTIAFSRRDWPGRSEFELELGAGRDRRLKDIDELASSRGWNLAVTGDAFLQEWQHIVNVSLSS